MAGCLQPNCMLCARCTSMCHAYIIVCQDAEGDAATEGGGEGAAMAISVVGQIYGRIGSGEVGLRGS
jgi:hypothetical protein